MSVPDNMLALLSALRATNDGLSRHLEPNARPRDADAARATRLREQSVRLADQIDRALRDPDTPARASQVAPELIDQVQSASDRLDPSEPSDANLQSAEEFIAASNKLLSVLPGEQEPSAEK